jgi:hypothetical protein
MKVKELIEKLQQYDPDMVAEVGTRDDSEEIIAVYHVNLYQGKDVPHKQVICIDIVKEEQE